MKNNLLNTQKFTYLKPEIFSKIDLLNGKIALIDDQIDNVRDETDKILTENTVKSLYGIEVKKFEILYDFLFNNSKRIINVIENPKIENNFSDCYLSQTDSESVNTEDISKNINFGVLEPDNAFKY